MRIARKRLLLGRALFRGLNEGINSLSNVLTLILAARFSATSAEFGRIALVFSVYIIGLNTVRAFSSEIAMVSFLKADEKARPRLELGVLNFSILAGVIGGMFTVVVGGTLVPTGMTGWIILGVSAPFLLMQDTVRWLWLIRDRTERAIAIDSIWLVVMAATIAFLVAFDILSWGNAAWPVLGIWASAGTVSGIAGLWGLGLKVRLNSGIDWWRQNRRVGGAYFIEFLIGRGSAELAFLMAGAILGVAELGSLRLSNSLFGPLLVFTFGLQSMGVQEIAAAQNALEQWKVVRAVSALCFIASLAYGAILLFLPEHLLVSVLGAVSVGAIALIPINVVRRTLLGAMTGPWAGLRGQGKIAIARRLRVVSGILTIVGGTLGIIWGTALGVMVGLTIATTITTFLYFREGMQATYPLRVNK